MRIPIIKIHIVKESTLKKDLADAVEMGKTAQRKFTSKQMQQLVEDNISLTKQLAAVKHPRKGKGR